MSDLNSPSLRRTATSKSYARRLVAWMDDKMISIYEAMEVPNPDMYAQPRYQWWAKLVPGWIDPEWWRWRFDLFRDGGDDEYGPTWEARWSHRVRSATYRLGARLHVDRLVDADPDPLKFVRWLYRFNCRRRGHPAGIVFYNPSGYEPDTHCKDCGQDIG